MSKKCPHGKEFLQISVSGETYCGVCGTGYSPDGKKDVEVRGGFFWIQEGGNIIQHNPNASMFIHDTISATKPEWYQLKEWWGAFMLWVKL